MTWVDLFFYYVVYGHKVNDCKQKKMDEDVVNNAKDREGNQELMKASKEGKAENLGRTIVEEENFGP